jgi:hypothetical protein
MAIFKKDSEIEALNKKLDALKASNITEPRPKRPRRRPQQIAEVQAQLDAAERAAFVAAQDAAQAERTQVERDYRETLTAVVEATGELRDLLAALAERRKQCAALGIYPAQDFTGGLDAVLRQTFGAWDRYTTSLTGAPPKPSRERVAVDTCECDLRHREDALAELRARVEKYTGRRDGATFRQLLGYLDSNADAVRRERRNLAAALARLDDKGEATSADRRRRLELLEHADSEALTLAF